MISSCSSCVASSAVLHFIFLLLQLITFQTSQLLVAADVLPIERRLSDDPSGGFINIDCGLTEPGPTYNPNNGLYYTSDEKYISTGINSIVSPDNYQNYPTLFRTLRSFPEGHRNCYSLSPLKPNHTYLIRAQFMYGNYDGRNSTPTFDLYIGVNFWLKVSLSVSLYVSPYKEIIHVATTKSIDVCLVNTGQGTPYINSLELRPLDINSPYVASPSFSLHSWYHNDLGGSTAQEAIYEVKDDAYDRFWYRFIAPWKVITNINETFAASQANPCKVPISVLLTACEQDDGGPYWALGSAKSDSISKFHFYWHFAELELLRLNETREFNIFVPYAGYKSGPIRPKYLQVTTIVSPRISTSDALTFILQKTNESNRYPILNAVELYRVVELPASPTNQEDVDSITAIKDSYVIPKIWQGDPCLPKDYQWDGLNCSYDGINPPRIISLSLSSSNLTGGIPPSLSKLTSLQYLNLSNNVFTGKIPEFLTYLPSLNVIDLSGNNLMGPVPPLLAEKARNKSIDLRLEGNPDVCKSYHCEENLVVDKKRYSFSVPIVVSIALVSFIVVIIGIIFLAFKRTKKQGLMDGAIKQKNKQFKYSDIVRITDSFKKVLGKGGFGTVYYGALQDGTEVAVKLLNHTSSTIILKQFCSEAELLTRTHHVNLVSLIGYCDEHANMALVYEYMSSGDLQKQLSEKNEHPLSWKARLQISIDAAQGLEYLHSGCIPPIIHRDIKPANILLDEMGHAKIADFGLSRFFTTDSQGAAVRTDLAGTWGYLDPEYRQPINTLSEKSDVYAFGIVLLQLLTGQSTNVKNTNYQDEDDIEHIVDWVSPKVESGDILAIIDKRLQQDLNVNSAWKFLEIALECVKGTAKERPRMTEVVVDLKACYASEGLHYQNAANSVGKRNPNMNSSQPPESIVSMLIAR